MLSIRITSKINSALYLMQVYSFIYQKFALNKIRIYAYLNIADIYNQNGNGKQN